MVLHHDARASSTTSVCDSNSEADPHLRRKLGLSVRQNDLHRKAYCTPASRLLPSCFPVATFCPPGNSGTCPRSLQQPLWNTCCSEVSRVTLLRLVLSWMSLNHHSLATLRYRKCRGKDKMWTPAKRKDRLWTPGGSSVFPFSPAVPEVRSCRIVVSGP